MKAIITDLNMPLVNGKELITKCKQAKYFKADFPYVLITANPVEINQDLDEIT
jgi:CheY-like chemotaxis protein